MANTDILDYAGLGYYDGKIKNWTVSDAAVTAAGSTTGRTLPDRFADVVNVRDFGAEGDGVTDDTVAIQAAAAVAASSGKPLSLPGKYLVSGLVLPDSTQIAGSAIFVDAGDGEAQTYVVRLGKNCTADYIELEMVNNGNYRFGVGLKDGCSIGRVKVFCSTSDYCNSEALIFGGDNILVGFLETKNITRGGTIGASKDIVYNDGTSTGITADGKTHYKNITLGGYFLDGMIQGLRISRAQHSQIGQGFIRGLPESIEWTPSNGYNGLYITASDHIEIGDVEMDLIMEHGIRLAGDDNGGGVYSFVAHDIHIGKVVSYRHGGSAVKLNCGPTKTIYNVSIDGIISIDAGLRDRANTRRLSTLRLSHCYDVSVGDLVSKTTSPDVAPIETEWSETDTVEICNSSNITINNIEIDKCSRSPLCFNQTNDGDTSAVPYSDYVCDNINIASMSCSDTYQNYFYAIRFYSSEMTVSHVTIQNVDCWGSKFSDYFRETDGGITTKVTNFYISCIDKEKRAFVANMITRGIIVNAVSGGSGFNYATASSLADMSNAVSTSGIWLAQKTSDVSIGVGPSLVFARRASVSRPAGSVMSYQFSTSGGRAGLAFATCDGTTASNALTLRWLMGWENGGELMPAIDNVTNLGGASNRIKEIFAANATINTSDARDKTALSEPSEALMKAWSKVRFKTFQFSHAVDSKGGSARIHLGVVAQDVAEAFSSEGLDAGRYGLFCHDEWEEHTEQHKIVDVPEEMDADGNVIVEEVSHIEQVKIPAGDRYGIRYEEALALECAYQRWLGKKRDARIDALEAKIYG